MKSIPIQSYSSISLPELSTGHFVTFDGKTYEIVVINPLSTGYDKETLSKVAQLTSDILKAHEPSNLGKVPTQIDHSDLVFGKSVFSQHANVNVADKARKLLDLVNSVQAATRAPQLEQPTPKRASPPSFGQSAKENYNLDDFEDILIKSESAVPMSCDLPHIHQMPRHSEVVLRAAAQKKQRTVPLSPRAPKVQYSEGIDYGREKEDYYREQIRLCRKSAGKAFLTWPKEKKVEALHTLARKMERGEVISCEEEPLRDSMVYAYGAEMIKRGQRAINANFVKITYEMIAQFAR